MCVCVFTQNVQRKYTECTFTPCVFTQDDACSLARVFTRVYCAPWTLIHLLRARKSTTRVAGLTDAAYPQEAKATLNTPKCEADSKFVILFFLPFGVWLPQGP